MKLSKLLEELHQIQGNQAPGYDPEILIPEFKICRDYYGKPSFDIQGYTGNLFISSISQIDTNYIIEQESFYNV